MSWSREFKKVYRLQCLTNRIFCIASNSSCFRNNCTRQKCRWAQLRLHLKRVRNAYWIKKVFVTRELYLTNNPFSCSMLWKYEHSNSNQSIQTFLITLPLPIQYPLDQRHISKGITFHLNVCRFFFVHKRQNSYIFTSNVIVLKFIFSWGYGEKNASICPEARPPYSKWLYRLTSFLLKHLRKQKMKIIRDFNAGKLKRKRRWFVHCSEFFNTLHLTYAWVFNAEGNIWIILAPKGQF